MWKVFCTIAVIGVTLGAATYAIAVGIIEFCEYIRIRQCGLHICRFCNVKNKCSWKSEWEEIKRGRE